MFDVSAKYDFISKAYSLRDDDIPEDKPENSVMGDMVRDAVKELPNKYQTVLELYFGFKGLPNCTLQRIGELTGTSRPACHNLKKRALRKIMEVMMNAD